ncbi:MAG: hypothetical protein R2745_23355 [Vicinamibacterales bacterium]
MTTGVRLAIADDDAGLRALLRRSVMPGAVTVAFTREPAYGAGAGLAGADERTIVLEHDGTVVGMGRCSVRTLHRNGRPCRLGYLSELRTDAGIPGVGRALREGYRLLGDWAASTGVEGVFTSIADDNARARQVLEHGGRLGLPAYRAVCELVTLVAPVARGTAVPADGAAAPAVDELTAFLARHAPSTHLTLAWDGDLWTALAAHGLTPVDFAVVRDRGRIVAAAGLWDQRAFRQIVVDALHGALGVMRPVVNLALGLRGRPVLPGPGDVVAQAAVVAPTVAEAGHWPALHAALQARAAARGLAWTTVALDRRDPALTACRRLLRPREYRTTLYDVRWSLQRSAPEAWDARGFRPEVGLL